MVEESVLRKVKKALALANDKSSAEESQTAMLLAQRLLAKHDLTIQDVGEDWTADSKKEVVEEAHTEYARTKWYIKRLSSIIAMNFRCYSIITRDGRGYSQMRFIGLSTDVALAKEVFSFALHAVEYHAKKYMKENNLNINRCRAIQNDYITGFLNGIAAKFEEQKDNEEWGLVLTKDEIVEKNFQDRKLKKGRSYSWSSFGNEEAKMKGYSDGKQLDHARKHID